MDAPSKSLTQECAPTPAWKTLPVFHSRLDAVLRGPVRGTRAHISHRPLLPLAGLHSKWRDDTASGYIPKWLDGATPARPCEPSIATWYAFFVGVCLAWCHEGRLTVAHLLLTIRLDQSSYIRILAWI